MSQIWTVHSGAGPHPSLPHCDDTPSVANSGIPLQRGRTFTAADMAPGAARTALINERLANFAWPGENPIGKRLSMWDDEPRAGTK